MNLFQVVKSLQTIALSNPYIRNVGDGSIYDFMNANPSIRYGVFFVSQTSHREDDIFDWYGFNLFVIDRLVDNLESNRLQIQSVAKDVLSNTIKTFINKFLGITHEEIFYTPFTERFSDLCAGQYCNVEFRIPKAIICEEDFEDIIPIHPDCPECPDMDDVYESGRTDGINYQKSLLTSTAITENGTYTRENGFSEVEVNIEGSNLQPLNVTYMRNGHYEMTADPGYDGFQSPFAITVDVPQTGHTDEEMREQFQSGYTSGYTDGFESGHTSGITEQKNLLVSTAITENGTYTRENGFSAITVNVPQSGYTQEDLDAAYQRGFNDGVSSVDCTPAYESGYTSGYTDGYESGYTDGSSIAEYKNMPLTLEVISDGTIRFGNPSAKSYEYRINNGSWLSGSPTDLVLNVVSGDIVQFRGEVTLINSAVDNCTFYATTCQFKTYGNIMSIYTPTSFENVYTIPSGHNFSYLFKDCTGLTDASNLVLPATSITQFCYSYMFDGCINLVTPPSVLPATTLAYHSYSYMFTNCASLTTAPLLPAPVLTQYCYESMFNGCRSLSYIKCLATDISATNCTSNWVSSVAATGTFVKSPNMTEWTRNYNGIPVGWTVEE